MKKKKRMQTCIFIWLVFELTQLVASERALRGAWPGEVTACAWSLALALYYAWMLAMFAWADNRSPWALMLAVSSAGFLARRAAARERIFTMLTLEGAIRVGILLALLQA